MKILSRIMTVFFISSLFSVSLKSQEVHFIQSEKITDFYNPGTKGNMVMIDARDGNSYMASHVEGAVNIDISGKNTEEMIKRYLQTDTILMYCNIGKRSGRLSQLFSESGYTGHIFIIEDGFGNIEKNHKELLFRKEESE